MDFNLRQKGFYLSEDVNVAAEWMKKKSGKTSKINGAILIFEVEKAEQFFRSFLGVDLMPEAHFDDWKEVVQFYRTNKTEMYDPLPSALSRIPGVSSEYQIDYIRGPIWHRDWLPDHGIQVCLKSEKIVEAFIFLSRIVILN